MISYSIPLPPSVNGLFVEVAGESKLTIGADGRPVMKPTRERIKVAAYKAWRKEAGWMIAQQGRRHVLGPVSVLIEMVKPSKQRMDVDNRIKAAMDLLVEMDVIEDDSKVQEVTARWVSSGEPCCVTISPVP